jgi:fucose permease
LLLGFILFFESGMEIMVGGWAATFFREELAIETSSAVLFLSFYWLGMIATRLVLGIILKRVSPAFVLRVSLLIAFSGALMMFFAQGLALALPGLLLIGIGFAAGFPIILGYIGDQYPGLSGTAFSVAFVIALTGGMLLPYFTGLIGNLADLRTSFLIIPVSILIMLILFGVVLKRIPATKSVPQIDN